MHPRLTRSSSDVMIAGVCGGLGEFFSIDPVVARLIFVILGLNGGIGVVVYGLLWLLMPKKNAAGKNVGSAPSEQQQNTTNTGQGQHAPAQPVTSQQHVASPGLGVYTPPNPASYRFDPQTGDPIFKSENAAIGETIKLEFDADTAQPSQSTTHPSLHYSPSAAGIYHPPDANIATPPVEPHKKVWRKLGGILIGVGALVLLNHFGVSMGLIVPPMMIVAGIVLLKRSR